MDWVCLGEGEHGDCLLALISGTMEWHRYC